MRAAGQHRLAFVAAALAIAVAGGARAEGPPGTLPPVGEGGGAGGVNRPLPQLAGVDVVERLGATIPLDTTLRDETGAPIRLGSVFGDGLPVVLTFNYSSCPKLCSVMLGGLTAALVKLEWSAGRQFRVVTIGLDPDETYQKAMDTKMSYLGRYGRDSAEDGWRFLTGDAAAVKALAEAVGFGYRIEPSTGEILHPAVLILASSAGVVNRYVYGVEFDPVELRSALVTTGLGQPTEATTKFLLACFHTETVPGFAATAMKVMRLGGLLFVLVAGFFFVRSIRSSRVARRRLAGSH